MFLDFYQLRQQPFGVTPDPAFLYPSRTHREALASMTEGIQGGRGFLCLIAEPGMGKTTLLYQLLEGLRERARTAFLFQTQCNSREFFQYLLSELGVDTNGMGLVTMHNKLNEMLFAEMLAGKRFVLIVDEAQNLDDSVLETVRLLSNFETSHTKLLQIVLAGQPQLAEKLAQPRLEQLAQRITVLNHLVPFSPEETEGYIDHRLYVAGYNGNGLFTPEAVAVVAERSRGIPRNINRICFHALSDACAQGHQFVTEEVVRGAVAKLEIRVGARAATASLAAVAATTTAAQRGGDSGAVEASDAGLEAAEEGGAAGVPAADQDSGVDSGLGSEPPAVVAEPETITYKPARGFSVPWRMALWAVLGAILLPAGGWLVRTIPWQQLRVQAAAAKAPKTVAPKTSGEREDVGAGAQGLGNSFGLPLAPARAESEMADPRTANVTGVEITNGGAGDERVVVTLDHAVKYDSARIGSPDRIYFDLRNTQLRPVLEREIRAKEGEKSWVRAAQNKDGVVRLVLGADGAKEYEAQWIANPTRLVIDVHAAASANSTGANTPSAVPAKAVVAGGEHPSLTRELGLKINRIVIDPGHGGYDTGTIGPHGLMEKDLCLDVALRLGQLIDQNIPGAQVIYTRRNDSHVALEERTAIANRANADLFISIHANASDYQQARGVETYYLSFTNSPEAMALAVRENALAQSSLHELPDLLKKIARNDEVAESKRLAAEIQSALAERLQLVSGGEKNRGVKQAPFIVLSGANMPSVLSEISFVSNAIDESLLQESPQRQRVAEGLYRGIAAYLDSLHSLPHNKPKLSSENRANEELGSASGGTSAARPR
jgi:N-acetylmuramoyl-L-alanine amidase/type II secretory pathway predicted ATPase ExeA